MSIIDNAANSVVSYDSKTSKAFAGQRLSKVQYKTVTDKESVLCGIKRPSMCVSIPLVEKDVVIANATALSGMVCEYLQSVQDKMIKEMIEAGQKNITNESISIAAIIEWNEGNNESGRITKDTVAKWFEEEISESLAVVLGEKLGFGVGDEKITDAQSNQVMKAVGVFKDKVSALAGGKTMYEPKVAESIKKALALASNGDALRERFVARLDKMIEEGKKMDELVDLL